MDRAQKQENVEALSGVFASAGAVVVTHYLGLTVAEMTDLRGRLRNEGAQLQVVKNTLAQKALGGSIGEKGDALFKGPVAIAFAADPVSAAKVATQYAKDNEKFSVIGGFMGQQVLDKNSVTALATLYQRQEFWRKAVEMNPEDSRAHFNLAHSLNERLETASKMRSYRSARRVKSSIV